MFRRPLLLLVSDRRWPPWGQPGGPTGSTRKRRQRRPGPGPSSAARVFDDARSRAGLHSGIFNFIHSGIFVWGGSRTNRQQRRGDTLCALEYPSLSPPYVADFVAALHASRLQASTVRFLYLGPGTDQKFGFWGGPSPRTFEFADF